MIKANELRIGNYFYEINRSSEIHLPVQNPLEVVSIELDKVRWILPNTNLCHYRKTLSTNHCDTSPIPLTEEWLVKFNWKRLDKYTFTLNGWFIYKRKRGFVTGSKKRETLLESVHDLQNWHYCNNNKKELEIN